MAQNTGFCNENLNYYNIPNSLMNVMCVSSIPKPELDESADGKSEDTERHL